MSDLDLEKESKKNLSQNAYRLPIIQVNQDYLHNYHQKTSLYHFTYRNGKTNLLIYNIENESKETKILETPIPLELRTSVAQLPSGRLFCLSAHSEIIQIIDMNGEIETHPSWNRCSLSSIIYFNQNIYCFGGIDKSGFSQSQSLRYDLNLNHWTQLAPMSWADYNCNFIIFNRNILISGMKKRKILLYSTDLNSFSIIPHMFAEDITKILINVEERLYLIECGNRSIFESEIADYTVWNRIGWSIIEEDLWNVYCTYNKGVVYIGCNRLDGFFKSNILKYFKFDLNQKVLDRAI